MEKSLDKKLTRILADRTCRDFILADAKDGDMAFGVNTPGRDPAAPADTAPLRTLEDYRQFMREVTRQGLVDIMLMSVSSSEQLTIKERLFDDSPVTPAIRANDTTDIWLGDVGHYTQQPSLPFRSSTIDHAQCGRYPCTPAEREVGADLGLYSITFNNDVHHDRESLQRYREFRLEAEQKGFRHFLEVFQPNAPIHPIVDMASFINDSIARTLAGVPSASRPVFLKIPYLGPRAMEALVRYDTSLVIGILGGSAGTTHDAFRLLYQAKKHGARAALFGRKINFAEHQLTFVKLLRSVADDEIEPDEAVRAYHAELKQLDIQPRRGLEQDLEITQAYLNDE